MRLTNRELIKLDTFFHTDKTYSYHIQNRDIPRFKSLVDKGLVVITPDSKYPGISLAKLVDNWNENLGNEVGDIE